MANKSKAIIVICPGGAYQWLSPREAEPVARAFEAMGYETSILRYTVQAEGDPAPLRDIFSRGQRMLMPADWYSKPPSSPSIHPTQSRNLGN